MEKRKKCANLSRQKHPFFFSLTRFVLPSFLKHLPLLSPQNLALELIVMTSIFFFLSGHSACCASWFPLFQTSNNICTELALEQKILQGNWYDPKLLCQAGFLIPNVTNKCCYRFVWDTLWQTTTLIHSLNLLTSTFYGTSSSVPF